jgi:hypothetical protein
MGVLSGLHEDAMVVAMCAMSMMKVAADPLVDVVSMLDHGVTAGR